MVLDEIAEAQRLDPKDLVWVEEVNIAILDCLELAISKSRSIVLAANQLVAHFLEDRILERLNLLRHLDVVNDIIWALGVVKQVG